MKEKKNNKKEVKKTYIINLDGMKADYFGSMGHQGCLTPTLASLAELGIRFTNCKAIMPANTGTNHTAIMTGAHAGSHGILGAVGHYKKLDFNHPRLSKRYGSPKGGLYAHRHLQVPTFFNIIKANNPDLVTAFIPGKTWLGNIIADEDCDITIYPGNTSENCDEHKPNPSYVTPPEGYVLGGPARPEDNEIIPRLYIPKKGEIQQEPPGTFSIGVLKATADPLPSDKWLIDQAIKCVDHDDPDFMYMILMNIDAAGHGYGASLTEKELGENDIKNLSCIRNPEAMRDQLYLTDQEVKRFIDHLKDKGLFDNARIVITSDHGMSTLKSLFSMVSWKNIVYWLLEKIHVARFTGNRKTFLPIKIMEELDIDIRRILAKHGIHMRASQNKWFHWYNSGGKYDWCLSDGGPACYIYNANPPVQKKIKDVLLNYTIRENGEKKHPIWKVLTEEDMDYAKNEYTSQPFHLGRGEFNEKYDAMWPSVIIFLKPHYIIPLYNDHLTAGLTPLGLTVKLPGFIDVRSGPGSHGTYLEQNVPFILVSPSESEVPSGVVLDEQVSVLDVVPTINTLNGWPDQPTFEGKPLIPATDKQRNRKRNRLPEKGIRYEGR